MVHHVMFRLPSDCEFPCCNYRRCTCCCAPYPVQGRSDMCEFSAVYCIAGTLFMLRPPAEHNYAMTSVTARISIPLEKGGASTSWLHNHVTKVRSSLHAVTCSCEYSKLSSSDSKFNAAK